MGSVLFSLHVQHYMLLSTISQPGGKVEGGGGGGGGGSVVASWLSPQQCAECVSGSDLL